MGAALRVYRRRIRSVNSTKKITKAMELIAASRIVRAQNRMRAAQPYAREIQHALAQLSRDRTLKHPMLTGVEDPQRAGILVVTSDRGLAGGYNSNALRAVRELTARLEGEGKQVERYVIGRKGAAYFRFRTISMAGAWTGFSEQPNFVDARGATDAAVAALTATSRGEISHGEHQGEPGIDELWVVYTKFVNSVTQTPVAEQVAPVNGANDDSGDNAGSASDGNDDDHGDDENVSYEFEPEPSALIAALLPATSARGSSRRCWSRQPRNRLHGGGPMKSASDNATELIKTYTRLANQARQAEITQEISEIVGGADALASAGSEE